MATQTLDTYLDLCTQVYDLSKPLPPEDAYRFYRHYAQQCNGPILEPMCGTGRFLLPLLEEGFTVHGFDASDSMLKELHKKATYRGLKPNVWRDFLQELHTTERYGLAFIPTGSFGLITEIEQAKASLKAIHRHLRQEGTLVFEVENITHPCPTPGVWRGGLWPLPDNNFIVSSYLTMLPNENNIEITVCKYELIKNHQVVKTEYEFLKVRLYHVTEVRQMLKESGFHHIRLIQPFQHEKEGSESNELLIFECRK